VASCKDCLEQLAFLINVTESALPEVPLQLLSRTQQQIAPETIFSNWTPALAIAGCLAAVVGIALMQEPRHSALPTTVVQNVDKSGKNPVEKQTIAFARKWESPFQFFQWSRSDRKCCHTHWKHGRASSLTVVVEIDAQLLAFLVEVFWRAI
jgi:hypothetical protein